MNRTAAALPTAPLRVTHVITDLDTGGAEIMLRRLVARLDPARCVSEVISLKGQGPVGADIAAGGIPVRDARMRSPLLVPTGAAALFRQIRRSRPDVVQTWIYHADLAGGIAARLQGVPVCWGLHNSTPDPALWKWGTRMAIAACARLSRRIPTTIVSCSRSAAEAHVAAGYCARRMRVIPNGTDMDVFRPDPAAAASVRRALGIPGGSPIVGFVGRYHPQKDCGTFVRAAATLHASNPRVHFVMCGDGVAWKNRELDDLVRAAGVQHVTHLLGRRDDMPRLHASFDIMSLSSAFGEAFPLAVCEAMACGVPPVATDLGDTAEIIGDAGRVVPVRDVAALAAAWQALLDLPAAARRQLGLEARRRIADRFSLDAVAEQYRETWRRAAGAV